MSVVRNMLVESYQTVCDYEDLTYLSFAAASPNLMILSVIVRHVCFVLEFLVSPGHELV